MRSIFNGLEINIIMNLEDKVKSKLLGRGFSKELLLNNRGLIGAAIDETVLEVVKNINYDTLLPTAVCCYTTCNEPVVEGRAYCQLHNNG